MLSRADVISGEDRSGACGVGEVAAYQATNRQIGTGSVTHLVAMLFTNAAGSDMPMVLFKDTGPGSRQMKKGEWAPALKAAGVKGTSGGSSARRSRC